MSRGSKVLPIHGERALELKRAIVVADLHMGIEYDFRNKGAVVPSQTKNMERKLLSLINRRKAEELIVLGDLKHSIPSTSIDEYREIPQLINSLKEYVRITVVTGNHDGNLEKLIPDVPIFDYLERDGALLAHGHSWIKRKSIDAPVIILAHSHPAVAFSDDYSRTVKEPVWIRGRFNEKIKEFYRVTITPEFIVIPAFNPLILGTAFNRSNCTKLLGPYFNSGIIDFESAHAYLLDGTDLGELSNLLASH
jgi:putative SbcD/Mre11-related phosphoesterase